MKNKWEDLEMVCQNFLNAKYSTKDIHFKHIGGHDSRSSDIYVELNNTKLFSIEVKSPTSQCRQFVLFPDTKSNRFSYSRNNQTPINKYSQKIIDIMSQDFEIYSNTLKHNHPLPDNEDLYSKWIIDYYKNYKNTRFIITKDANGFVIFPVEALLDYFHISATYRIKASGSSKPSKNDIQVLNMYFLQNNYNYSVNEIEEGNKKRVFLLGNYREPEILEAYGKRFKITQVENKENSYIVRRLSNTKNQNVIFSIKLYGKQRQNDSSIFEKAIFENP